MSALGVKSPHLQLLKVNELFCFKPHILKHHIHELPTSLPPSVRANVFETIRRI